MVNVLRYARNGDYARFRECIREALSLRVVDTLEYIRPLVAEEMTSQQLMNSQGNKSLMARLAALQTSKQFEAPSSPIVLPPHIKRIKVRNNGSLPGRSSYSQRRRDR